MYKSKKNDNNNKNNKDKKNTVRNSKDQERTTVTLKVAEAYHRDIGRGIARIDPKICKKLDLLTGDTIEVSIFPPQGGSNDNNKAKAVVLNWPAYEEDYGKGLATDSNYHKMRLLGS